MKEIRKRLTYANVMSSLAVFMVLGGGAAIAADQLAKNSVGTKQLKKNAVKANKLAPKAVKTGKLAPSAVKVGKLAKEAVKAGKIANGAVMTDKIADGGVTASKLGAGSVLSDKIAANAVTADKLAPSERSQVLTEVSPGLGPEVPTGVFGDYAAAPSAVSKVLPAGTWLVQARTEFFNSAIEQRSEVCRLFDDGVQIASGSTPLGEGILVLQGEVSTTGISDGGTVSLHCRAIGDDTFLGNGQIVALRVSSVN